MKNKINVAIVGLGNCASSLIQGIGYYSEKKHKHGLINNDICGYKISDINILAGIDVNVDKIGKTISEAIFQKPNCSVIFHKGNMFTETVIPGPILDGISKRMMNVIETHKIKKSIIERESYIVDFLVDKKIDILLSYLPVGSKKAAKFYANCALKSKVGYINAMPEFICSDERRSKKFKKNKIPCAGDDIKSQIGATIVHRYLVDLFNKRGGVINNTYQLNVGGNSDFQNMLDEERLLSKRKSKTLAVTSVAPFQKFSTKIGPSEYISHLEDKKICYIQIEGKGFADTKISLDLKLEVQDSPNSAGIMVDVIRLLQVAKNNKLSGYQDFSAYYFKHPYKQYLDNEGKNIVDDFIKKYN